MCKASHNARLFGYFKIMFMCNIFHVHQNNLIANIQYFINTLYFFHFRTSMCVDFVFHFLILCLSGDNLFFYFQTYLVIIGMVGCVVLQIRWLNAALVYL